MTTVTDVLMVRYGKNFFLDIAGTATCQSNTKISLPRNVHGAAQSPKPAKAELGSVVRGKNFGGVKTKLGGKVGIRKTRRGLRGDENRWRTAKKVYFKRKTDLNEAVGCTGRSHACLLSQFITRLRPRN